MTNISFDKPLSFTTKFKIYICAALVAVADLFFFHHAIGASAGFFGLAMVLFLSLSTNPRGRKTAVALASFTSIILAIAMIEMPNYGIIFLFIFSLLIMVNLPRMRKINNGILIALDALRILFFGWFQLPKDFGKFIKTGKNKDYKSGILSFRQWVLPLIMSLVFIGLFSQANPIISLWLSKINWDEIFKIFDPLRMGFWVIFAIIIWAILRNRLKPKLHNLQNLRFSKFENDDVIFGEKPILNSLAIFNIIFLIQNILDIIFLWSGSKLPSGMSYATYAHQGAYPLIVTALLAALFVQISFRPETKYKNQNLMNVLVFTWVGQNIFLVVSSILRTLKYVDEYSLTYMRIAALIWMGLVAFGLLLIVIRILSNKSNLWLINSNSITLAVVLIISSFVNYDRIIAWHNVNNCREITGHGIGLDAQYLVYNIGTEALPALIWYNQNLQNDYYSKPWLEKNIASLKHRLELNISNWHSWTYREYRTAKEVGILSQN